MNRKGIITLMLAAMLAASALAGCSGNNNGAASSGAGSEPSSNISSDVASDISSDMSNVESEAGAEGGKIFGLADTKLTAAYDAARKAMGEEGFILNPMDDTARLEEAYGVSPDLVDSAIVEVPMMSTHVGIFVGIKAKEGKGGDVETALNAYRDKIAADELQYPMNAQKTKSGLVVREGDYVFYLMLGAVTDEAMDLEDADQLAYYQGENQKAADAIKEAVK